MMVKYCAMVILVSQAYHLSFQVEFFKNQLPAPLKGDDAGTYLQKPMNYLIFYLKTWCWCWSTVVSYARRRRTLTVPIRTKRTQWPFGWSTPGARAPHSQAAIRRRTKLGGYFLKKAVFFCLIISRFIIRTILISQFQKQLFENHGQ